MRAFASRSFGEVGRAAGGKDFYVAALLPSTHTKLLLLMLLLLLLLLLLQLLLCW